MPTCWIDSGYPPEWTHARNQRTLAFFWSFVFVTLSYGSTSTAQDLVNKNAELSARLRLSQRVEATLKAENEKIKADNQRLQVEASRHGERVVLLEENLPSPRLKLKAHSEIYDQVSSF